MRPGCNGGYTKLGRLAKDKVAMAAGAAENEAFGGSEVYAEAVLYERRG